MEVVEVMEEIVGWGRTVTPTVAGVEQPVGTDRSVAVTLYTPEVVGLIVKLWPGICAPLGVVQTICMPDVELAFRVTGVPAHVCVADETNVNAGGATTVMVTVPVLVQFADEFVATAV
jgi:hypothetical protein